MRVARTILAVAGLAIIFYAIGGSIMDDGVNIGGVVAFLTAVLIGHDLIALPVAIGVGVLVSRYVPGWARSWVQGALFASAVVTVMAIPLLVAAGRVADNPSRLPLDYPRGLLIVLVGIWFVAGAGALVARRRVRPPRGGP